MVSPFPRLQTAVVIFVLVLGNASPVHTVGFSVSAIAAAATQTISSGGILTGKTMQAVAAAGYKVTCVIQVENWTRYPLLYGTPRLSGGAVTSPPTAVLPSKRNALATRKNAVVHHGVWGTVTWEVKGANRLFVIMWSVPYSFDTYTNWMALGVTRKGLTQVPDGDHFFNKMYYGESDSDLTFIRRQYYRITDPIIYRDDEFEIVGIMTNIHRSEVKVTFRPSKDNWEALSDQIQQYLNHPQNCTACDCDSQ